MTVVTLNRPRALNALNSQVLAELLDAFVGYDADDSQRCAVLKGSDTRLPPGRTSRKCSRRTSPTCMGGEFSGYTC